MNALKKRRGLVWIGLVSICIVVEMLISRRTAFELHTDIRQTENLRRELQRLRAVGADRREKIASLQAESLPLKPTPTWPLEGDAPDNLIGPWLSRVARLRQQLIDHPELGIPELRWVTDQDWLDVARSEITSNDDVRRALAKLRAVGTQKFSQIGATALKKYADANHGAFPTDLNELQPFFENPADAAVLERYAIIPQNQVPFVQIPGEQLITQSSQVDPKYDVCMIMGPMGTGASFSSGAPGNSYLNVLNAFRAANQGRVPSDPSQLVPYTATPDQDAVVENAVEHKIRPSITFGARP